MTQRAVAPSVMVMKRHLTPHNLIILALTAVFSLAFAHMVDLGSQLLGAEPASTLALIGDAAGLLACALSARLGLRHLHGAWTC
jgi:hypothetical protein